MKRPKRNKGLILSHEGRIMVTSKAVHYSPVIGTPFSSHKWDVNSKEESRLRRSLTLRAKVSLVVAVVMTAVVVAVLVTCFVLPKWTGTPSSWPSYESRSRLGRFRRAALSTDAAPCAHVARTILEKGGSAVDSAIAALACMGAHNPHSMGLGGGFLMLYYNRTEQRAYYIDAREVAPRKSTPDMYHGNATLAAEGGLSIAVPGELAGYWEAHRQFGRLPWSDLFRPAAEMCRKGIEVSAHLARAIRNNQKRMMTDAYSDLGSVFLKNGTELYEAGDRIPMPALARTLDEIADQGMKALYGPSELADRFLQDMQKAGSIIDRVDMQSYAPRMLEPVQVSLRRNTTLYGVSQPGSGALLAFMMAVLDGYPDMDESVKQDEYRAGLAYHRLIETMKFGYAYRSHLEDSDSEEMRQLTEKLTSSAFAAEIRSRINDSRTFNDLSYYDADPLGFVEDHGTAHLSVVDQDGDAVSVTSTINQYFGSKILSPSTGIVLNDEMDDFSSPNIINMFDLPPSTKNQIRPGKRPMSSMTPVVLADANGDVQLVLGGNGGTTITSGVLQVAAQSLFFGADIKQSIDAPRIHHQLTPDIMHHEKNFPRALLSELHDRYGHRVEEWTMGMMSIMMGVHRCGEDLCANSDYRKGGEVDGF